MKTFAKAEKLKNVSYAVRGPVVDAAARMEEQGQKVLKLNIGNPAPFGFTAPDSALREYGAHYDTCQGYSESRGIMPARQAICAMPRARISPMWM